MSRSATKTEKDVSLVARMPPALAAEAQAYAKLHGTTVSALIRDGLQWRLHGGELADTPLLPESPPLLHTLHANAVQLQRQIDALTQQAQLLARTFDTLVTQWAEASTSDRHAARERPQSSSHAITSDEASGSMAVMDHEPSNDNTQDNDELYNSKTIPEEPPDAVAGQARRDRVWSAVPVAGRRGITIKALADQLGLDYRQVNSDMRTLRKQKRVTLLQGKDGGGYVRPQ